MAFWDKNEAMLKEKFGKEEFKITEELFEWGWMNVGTRVFGAHQLPSEIAMVPLLDLMNHDCD